MSSTKLLALVMMVKDEAKTIQSTLESVLRNVDGVVLMDTGSRDNTVKIASDVCERHEVPLHLHRRPFVDYGQGRTTLLQLGRDEGYEWLLMLSGTEVMRASELVRKRCESPGSFSAFDVQVDFGQLTYRHPRVTKAQEPYRYVGATHEYLKHEGTSKLVIHGFIEGAEIVHRGGGDKRDRWQQDEVLLATDLQEDPDNPRAQFYMAQTLSCLGRDGAAARFYKTRADNERGFSAERYESLLCLARIEPRDAEQHLSKAIELFPRWPDAFILLAQHHWKMGRKHSCFLYARRACELEFSRETLFSRKGLDLLRWDLLSATAVHAAWAVSMLSAEHYKLGRQATLKAVTLDPENTRLKRAFHFYAPTGPVHGQLVLVLGTGRCGTSAVAHMLSELGVPMGPDVPSDHANPSGYFEDRHARWLTLENEHQALVGYLAARVEDEGVAGVKVPLVADRPEEFIASLSLFESVVTICVERDLDEVQESYIKAWGPQWSGSEARDRLEQMQSGARRIVKAFGGPVLRYQYLLRSPERCMEEIAALIGVPPRSEAARVVVNNQDHGVLVSSLVPSSSNEPVLSRLTRPARWLEYLEISTVSKCSVACPYCPQEELALAYNDPTVRLTLENFVAIAKKIRPVCDRIDFAGFVEPFHNRECAEMIHAASDMGFKVRLFTTLNGASLEEIWSLPALDYLGIHLPTESMRMKVNDAYVQKLRWVYEHLKCDFYLLSEELHPKLKKDIPELLEVTDSIVVSRAQNVPFGLRRQHKAGTKMECPRRSYNHPVLLPDGTAVLCCQDYSLEHKIGNLLNQTLDEFLDSAEYRRVQQGLAGQLEETVLCNRCEYAKPA